MAFLIHPNIAYLLVLTGIFLLLFNFNHPKSRLPKVVMLLCFLAGGSELVYLKGNPWAFLLVALSPLPFFLAVRQAEMTRLINPLFLATILLLSLGAVYLFVDENGQPLVNLGIAAIVSIFGGLWIWVSVVRARDPEGARASNDPDSVVGMIGEVRTDIEPYSTGLILVDGVLWRARSKENIPAGRMVRVIRDDGIVLTVKEANTVMKK